MCSIFWGAFKHIFVLYFEEVLNIYLFYILRSFLTYVFYILRIFWDLTWIDMLDMPCVRTTHQSHRLQVSDLFFTHIWHIIYQIYRPSYQYYISYICISYIIYIVHMIYLISYQYSMARAQMIWGFAEKCDF